MPRQVSLRTDTQGNICLAPVPKGKSMGKGGRGLNENASKMEKGFGKGGHNAENFLASLPSDSLTQEEDDLRFHILRKLENRINPLLIEDAASDPQISKIVQSFLPSCLPLESWVKHRIGAEVHQIVKNNRHCFKIAGLSPEEKEAVLQEYFSSLPSDMLTLDEQKLRDAFYDFLATSQGSWFLSAAGGSASIKQCRRFLPRDVQLKAWIENRIGGEITLEPDPSKQFKMVLTEDGQRELESRNPAKGNGASKHGKGSVNEQRSKLTDATGKGKQQKGNRVDTNTSKGYSNDISDGFDDARGEVSRAEQDDRAVKREEWLSTLPQDMFTDEENVLADTLMETLAEKGILTLTALGMDANVQTAKKALIPKFVSLQCWISSRMGGELEIGHTDGSKEGFVGIRPIDMEALQAAASKIRSVNETSSQTRGARPGPAARARAKADGRGEKRQGPPGISTDLKRPRFGMGYTRS